ncbi:MAG: proline dehydrogenase family protein [Halobacteriales archaeon]
MIPPIASNFVAGESAATAIDHARSLNDHDVGAILNLLGEHYHERGPADGDADAYMDLIEDVASSDIRARVSLKPSQVGLDVGADQGERPTERGRVAFAENVERIVDHSREHGVFVWIDMEDHPTTDATLDVYEKMATKHGGGVGVCVQANLERTTDDIHRLAGLPGKVRLVKGAYDEPASVAVKGKKNVNERFRELIRTSFEEFDDGVGVATHDPEMIEFTERLAEQHDTGFEVQMLMGVRESAQYELAEDYEVWQYVPYGTKWFSYFYRRLMERKENALFAARAVLGG